MKSNTLWMTWVLTVIACTVMAQPAAKISPNDWAVFSDNDEPAALKDTVYLGKPSIRLDGSKASIAVRKGPRYKNLRIDCDIAGRVMSGIGFRAKDHQNYHFLYFRPGYGGTREAIQYVPVFNGTLGWVLYNYPDYEKTADIQAQEWFHVRLEVRGTVMKVFVNRSQEPQMSINLIESDFDEGDILLRSMFGESYFANFMVTEPGELLGDWQISQQFLRKETFDLDPATKSSTWTKAKPDAAGIVNIARYFENPNGVVIAKHALKADREKDMLLFFDFIGKLRVFVNGRELYHYEKYKLDRIFSGTERIPIHLNKGDNELVFVTEGDASFFGKGFNAMGRPQHQNWGFIAELNVKY